MGVQNAPDYFEDPVQKAKVKGFLKSIFPKTRLHDISNYKSFGMTPKEFMSSTFNKNLLETQKQAVEDAD